jgi:hypothetical protein
VTSTGSNRCKSADLDLSLRLSISSGVTWKGDKVDEAAEVSRTLGLLSRTFINTASGKSFCGNAQVFTELNPAQLDNDN